MIKIYGRFSSLNVQKVMWMVSEIDLEYEHINVGGSFGGLDTPKFLAMNPHGKIPVVDDYGFIVWESHSILRYLAAKYAETGYWPHDPGERSLINRWMDWGQTALQPAFMDLFWGYFRTPEVQRNQPEIEKAIEACHKQYGVLDKILSEHDFLTGDYFTTADMPAGSTLYRYFNMGLPTPELPHLKAWYDRLAQRPGYQKWVMQDFFDLKGKLDY